MNIRRWFAIYIVVVLLVAAAAIILLWPKAETTGEHSQSLAPGPAAETCNLPGSSLALAVPLACAVGSDCFVQNYFDHDPSPGVADFTCGALTYDGHDGTDIRARTLAQMEAGIPVLAAAPGIVVGTRNNMADININAIGLAALDGKEAGNGVRIDHGNGWFTQYAHMKQGSIAVRTGDTVAAGQQLGLMGLSGNTEFPHLHFSVQHGETKIDPYTGDDPSYACGAPTHPLWAPGAAPVMAYVPGAALAAGFAGGAADSRVAGEGGYDGFTLSGDGEALVFWASFFGVEAGDRILLTLETPGGAIAPVKSDTTIERDRAQQFQFAGRKRPDGGWPSGTYVGRASLVRTVDGTALVVSQIEKQIVLP